MRRGTKIAVAAAMVALGGAAVARADSPIATLQHFLADPANVFGRDPSLPARPRVTAVAPPVVTADVPLPHLRPGDGVALPALPYQAEETAPADLAPPAGVSDDDAVPTPHLRPADLLPAITAPSMAAGPKVAALTPVPFPNLVKPSPATDSACMAEIAALGVVATPLPPISDGECGIATPVSVSALEGGAVKLTPAATVDCSLAEHLANFVHDTVIPEARTEYGADLDGLRIADAYTCRPRDGIPGAKLSEHAHGTAIDISDFKVGDRWIDVGKDWSGGTAEDATFLADTRKAACGPFTTVLGPGSDSFHTSHFHLDIIQRRTAGPSHGLYCH